MHSKILVIVLLQAILAHCSPLWYNHDANWSVEPQIVNYKDQLKQWGLYPRIFRYGTGFSPKRNVNESATNLRRAGGVRKAVRPVSLSEWDAQHQTRYDERMFRKYKEQRLKRMEQEVAELLWKW